jgi:ribose/xylose/arabinose/galactoside ABC-type transport system permease subunit
MKRLVEIWARIFDPRTLPIAVTILLFCALFGFGSVMYTGFFSLQVLLDLLIDNAFLLIVAIGMTFVIVSGGIDLSVGSVVALTTIVEAVLSERMHASVWVILPIVLVMGALFGAVQGALIHFFRLQPFIVTLAGMFFARGLCFLITTQSITITDPTFKAISSYRLPIGTGSVSANVLIALVTLVAAIFVAHFTRFGRNVYAVGGNPRSALLMGLPVAHTRIGVYALSGFGARWRGLHVLRAVRLWIAGAGHGARRDRGHCDRRHLADRWCRLCHRLAVRRWHSRHDPDVDHLRRHAELVVDTHCDRRAAVRVLPAATPDRTSCTFGAAAGRSCGCSGVDPIARALTSRLGRYGLASGWARAAGRLAQGPGALKRGGRPAQRQSAHVSYRSQTISDAITPHPRKVPDAQKPSG